MNWALLDQSHYATSHTKRRLLAAACGIHCFKLGHVDHRHFIATFWGRYVASCAVVFQASLIVTVIFGGGQFLGEIFTVPWFPLVWKFGQTGIWRPWPLALITLVILAIAARWKWTSLIATVWFLLNALFALWFLSVYDGKS